jgi:hypothetical protein
VTSGTCNAYGKKSQYCSIMPTCKREIPCVTSRCTFTQGYWKNHPEAWPVSSLYLGTTKYEKAALIEIFNTPPTGNAQIILAHQLIAALLNQAKGADTSSITAVLSGAKTLFTNYRYGTGFPDSQRDTAIGYANTLDKFNNGDLTNGPPHCDNEPTRRASTVQEASTVDSDSSSSYSLKHHLPDTVTFTLNTYTLLFSVVAVCVMIIGAVVLIVVRSSRRSSPPSTPLRAHLHIPATPLYPNSPASPQRRHKQKFPYARSRSGKLNEV